MIDERLEPGTTDAKVLVAMALFVAGLGSFLGVADLIGYVRSGDVPFLGLVRFVTGAMMQCAFGLWMSRSGAPRVAMANFAASAFLLALLVVLVAVRAVG